MQELTRHLIEVHGRRRLAFIAGRGLEADERQRGFERALGEAGRFRVAGAHEDLMVYRRATGRCQRIATPGTWAGIGTELPHEATEEREFQLKQDT